MCTVEEAAQVALDDPFDPVGRLRPARGEALAGVERREVHHTSVSHMRSLSAGVSSVNNDLHNHCYLHFCCMHFTQIQN